MSRKLKPVSPSEMLAEEFFKPLGMSNYRLAKEIGVPAQRIGEILAGRRAITANTDFWLRSSKGSSDPLSFERAPNSSEFGADNSTGATLHRSVRYHANIDIPRQFEAQPR